MKNLKFEKVNMKLVIAIGVAIILVLTAMYIIFRTNLIIDHDKKQNNNEVTENENGESNKGDKDPETDPDNPNGGSSEGNNEQGNNGENGSNQEEPNYDDPYEEVDEGKVSSEAKKRTKSKDKLNIAEKKYIIKENMENELSALESDAEIKKNCVDDNACILAVENFNYYKEENDLIDDCSGEATFKYDKKKKKLVLDTSSVKCNS